MCAGSKATMQDASPARYISILNAAKFSIGAWLDGDAPVLLIDLIAMVPATA